MSDQPRSSVPYSSPRSPLGWLRRVGLATAVVMGVTAVPVLLSGEAVAEAGPVSGSFAMGGAVNGTVDERRGVFRAAVPLIGLAGRGGLDVSVSLSYDQQAAAGEQGTGRSGLGAGWGYGLPAVVTEGGLRVIPASGGSYEADTASATGLARYPLEDLKFEKKDGTLPAREGVEGQRAYSFVLAYDDGRTDYFDAAGDLVARTDRFGNRADFGWEVSPDGQVHRLAWAADTYGQKTLLEKTGSGVKVVSPVRSDGTRPAMELAVADGRLTSVTDPTGLVTRFHYDADGQPQLLTRAVSPTGATTVVEYKPVEYEPGLTVVDSVKVTDDNGDKTLSERKFSMDVEGGERRNYTGFPHYQDKGGDALFDAGDADDYTYTTELSDGKSTVRSTYNRLHLLTKREVKLDTGSGQATVQSQELHYEGEKDGRPPRPDSLPANYSKPVEATVTHINPATGVKRSSKETARFDSHGRQVERTDVTGAKTVTEYDPRFGLPVKTTTTGTDGAVAISENTLAGDGKSIAESKTLVGKKGEEPTARTVTASETDEHGEVKASTTGWADGARPKDDQGPEETTQTHTVEVDTGKHTRTDIVASPAGTSRQVTDLATGSVIAATDPAGRTATTEYDAAGRTVKQTAPDGLTTTTAYTPTSTTVTTPDGHVTVETTDLLGRTVKQTDNIRDGKIVEGNPGVRTLRSVAYSEDGLTATVTDGAGRSTVTVNDGLGRPVKTVAPNGMTQLTGYQDAATQSTSTKTTAILPAGEKDPARAVAVSTETYDNAERPVATAGSYADKTPTAPSSQAFDGLGRVKESLGQDVTTTPSYNGPGGTVRETTVTPQNTGTFPGEKITAGTKDDLTGAPTVKTLVPGQDTEGGRTGTTVIRDDAGRIVSETGQDGGKTTYLYTPDGQVRESVSPTGVKTVLAYEEKTGRVTEESVTSADGRTTEKTGYTYDPKTGRTTGVFDPDDRPGTLIAYTYDADGNILKIAYPDGKSLTQAFDDHGQLTSATDITGATTVYTHNADGTLKEAVQHDKDGEESARIAYTYDGLGRISKTVRGGESNGTDGKGVTTAYTYTDANQIKSEKTLRPDGTVITEAAYAYDSHGNLTHRTDHRPDTAGNGDGGQGSKPDGWATVRTATAYHYDAYDRLLGSEVKDDHGTLLSAAAYTFNVSGDVTRTETTGRDGKKTLTEHAIDLAGRLTAVTTNGEKTDQLWDKEGNLLTDHRGSTHTYDSLNRPLTTTTPDGRTTDYRYWADGTRATSTTTGKDGAADATTTRFHYTPDGTIANDTHTTDTTDGREGEAVTASYLLAGTRQARTLSGTGTGAQEAATTGAGYLLQDRHGNTTALTNSDGTVNATWNYTDYGQAANHTGIATASSAGGHGPNGNGPAAAAARNPFTHAGEYTNPDGTQYLRARTYDPTQTRFSTRDTAPQFNRYQAFGANPITNIDPSGHTEMPDWASYLLMGITLAVSVISVIATWGASTAALGIAIAGAALDLASTALETAALATGRNQLEDPLNIAAMVLGGIGLATGILSGITDTALGTRHFTKTGRTTAKEMNDFAGTPPLLDTSGSPTPKKSTLKGAIHHDPKVGVRNTDATMGSVQMTVDYERAAATLYRRIDQHYAQAKRVTAELARMVDEVPPGLSRLYNRLELPLSSNPIYFHPDRALEFNAKFAKLGFQMKFPIEAVRAAARNYDALVFGQHFGREMAGRYLRDTHAQMSLWSNDAKLAVWWSRNAVANSAALDIPRWKRLAP